MARRVVRAGSPLRQPCRRRRRRLWLRQRSRAGGAGPARHRSVVRGRVAVARRNWIVRAARLLAGRTGRHRPDGCAGTAALDGARANDSRPVDHIWSFRSAAPSSCSQPSGSADALFGAGPSLAAAALVACSPVVVFESLVVTADVPAAAFWICALAVALRRTGASTVGAGLLAGIAILIRPNLLPLAAFPWLLAICRVPDARVAAVRTALFAMGSVPAALVIAFVNHRVHGSAFISGYGDLGSAFAVDHAAINLRLYSGWWLESQGIAGVLFVMALWPWRAAVASRDDDPDRICGCSVAALPVLSAVRSVVVPALPDPGDSDRAAPWHRGSGIGDAPVGDRPHRGTLRARRRRWDPCRALHGCQGHSRQHRVGEAPLSRRGGLHERDVATRRRRSGDATQRQRALLHRVA